MTVLSEDDLDRAEALCLEVAQWAIARIGRNRPAAADTSTKADLADWVTNVDVAVERHTRERLAHAFANHVVIGEEMGGTEPGDGRPRWYVDPIDGTTNFVHGLPGYTYSLALADDGGLATGVLADPSTGDVFRARRGRGAWRNETRLRCPPTTNLVGGIVTMELANYRLWPGQQDLMAALEETKCVTRIIGSSALTIASVAAGRAAAACLGGANPIDVAAAVLIAAESGARVVPGAGVHPVLGGSPRVERTGLLVAAPGVADEMISLWAGPARAGG
jgi:myo-inositol-1(or 4)-monophosphatase